VLMNTTWGQYWMLHADQAPTYLGGEFAQGGGLLSPDDQWLMVPMSQRSGDWNYTIWNLFEEIAVLDELHKSYTEIVARFFDQGFAYLVLEESEPTEAFFFNYEDQTTIPLPAELYFDVTSDHVFLCGGYDYICVYHLGDAAPTTLLKDMSLIPLQSVPKQAAETE
ncbi:MAG: hypothetical protein K8J31_24460, partial [Anaerolineae bacterium]|nr:hypothetical protein [Anaerolineae bacterium]